MATQFGALIQTPEKLPPGYTILSYKMEVAKKLGITCVRDAVILTAPKKINSLGSGYDVILNVKWAAMQNNPVPFCTDLKAYANALDKLLASLTVLPAVIVIENEPCNPNYYSGTAAQYIALLRTAEPIVHKYGIKLADGGATDGAMRNLLSRNMTKEEKDAMAAAIGAGYTSTAAGDFTKEVWKAMPEIGLDYANMHWYQNTTNNDYLRQAIIMLRDATPASVGFMTNEIGQSYTDDPTVVTAMMKRVRRHWGMAYCLWYSGNSDTGARAKALHDDAGSLKPNGEAFRVEVVR